VVPHHRDAFASTGTTGFHRALEMGFRLRSRGRKDVDVAIEVQFQRVEDGSTAAAIPGEPMIS
jgi:hypothetical protein